MRGEPKNEFLGFVHAESVRAVLFECWYWSEPIWMPKSQIEITRGDYEVQIHASGWICRQNKIEEA
jgi:hypothetical protein